MSLNKRQERIRRTGIGASEVSALVYRDPRRQPIDVYLEKMGRVQRPPKGEEPLPIEIGNALEDSVRSLFNSRTRRHMVRVGRTFRHPDFPHVLASPDGLDVDARREDHQDGIEIKNVSRWMAHHWGADRIPDYVRDQAQQAMSVMGASRWHVVALIAGFDFRVYTIEHDDALEAELIESCEQFWTDHIVPRRAPQARDPEAHREYLLHRYPYEGEKRPCRDVGNGPDGGIATCAQWLREIDEQIKALQADRDFIENAFVELVGTDYGVSGPWGSFLHYPRIGNPQWKRIAEELAPDGVPVELIEKYRGESTRVPRLYAPKKSARMLTESRKRRQKTEDEDT